MSPKTANDVIRVGLWKGCLGGLGMALVFLIISGLIYLILIQTGLNLNLVWFFAILSGPLIGTAGLLVFVYRRAAKERSLVTSEAEDETTIEDQPHGSL